MPSATETPTNGLSAPDLSLVRPFARSEGKKLGPVHLDHFSKDNKHLYYIGSMHGTDFQNQSHEIIQQAGKKYKPELIIVEGVETQLGLSPSLGFDPKNPHSVKHLILHSNENIHTAEAARLQKIPFIGGEPTSESIFQALEKEGHSTKDVMAFFLIRTIPIWKRSGLLNEPEKFTKMANEFLDSNRIFKHIPKEARLTVDEFNSWYDAHKAEIGNKKAIDATAGDSNPNHAPDANYFQKMSNIMDQVRDRHLINLISDSLSSYDKVMVVYGNIHQYVGAPVFEQMFGNKPATEKLILDEEIQAPSPETPSRPVTIPMTIPESKPPVVNVTMPAGEKPSTAVEMFKYGSVALLAAGLTTILLGGLPVVAMALLAFSGMSYRMSTIAEAKQHELTPIPAHCEPSQSLSDTACGCGVPSYAVGRNDGKSWVATAHLPEPAQRSL